MITRIELTNFMSHGHTEIEPATGLTVLIGPNNCGKSAVVAALQTLPRNAAGDFMVRHGAKDARVTIEIEDVSGEVHTLAWMRKSSGGASYEIDGKPYDRLKRGVPENLHSILKLPEVEPAGGGDAF